MISFVYFDIGGVLLLDFSGTDKWLELQHDLGITKDNQKQLDTIWNEYENRRCIDFDIDALLSRIAHECHIPIPDTYSLLADFVNRFEPNPAIAPVISHIKESSNVGILSNMYPRMFDAIGQRKLIPTVEWDVVIDSSIVGCQKPDPEIYKIAEKQSGVESKEILFVENSLENIQAAKEMGWQTFLYDPARPDISSAALLAYFWSLME